MLTLTDRDLEVCASLAEEASGQPEDVGETFDILTTGFSKFGSEEKIPTYATRQKYFEALSPRLLENHTYADRDFDYFSKVLEGRSLIYRIVVSAGVPQVDAEDVVQEIMHKFWQGHWIEKYNPLMSSWLHFINNPVRKYVATYFERGKRKKRYTPNLVHTDFSRVYNPDPLENPESTLQIKELLGAWELFIQSQPSMRRGDQVDPTGAPFKRLCTLLPPGTIEIPTACELTLYFLRKGTHVARVALPELHSSGVSSMVWSSSLVDYITMDEVTGESLCGPDGNWLTQKYFINPLYIEYRKSLFKSFDYLHFYHYLRDGVTMDDIAATLCLSVKSVPYWVRKIEKLFRSFWLVTDQISMGLKYLAMDSYKCPGCEHLNYQNLGVCEECGVSMGEVSGKPRFPYYPWPKSFPNHEAKEAHEQRVGLVGVKHCAT